MINLKVFKKLESGETQIIYFEGTRFSDEIFVHGTCGEIERFLTPTEALSYIQELLKQPNTELKAR